MAKLSRAALGVALFLASTSVFATPFDFESTALGTYAGSLVLNDGPVSLTVTPEGFLGGSLTVNGNGVPFVGRGVIGNQNLTQAINGFAPLRFTFSQLISDITFAFGDGGGDDDSPWFIRAYSASDALLATNTGAYPLNFGGGMTSSMTGLAGASYFLLSSTPVFNPHSLLWDVQSYKLAAVPEPATAALLGIGLLGLALRRRRRAA